MTDKPSADPGDPCYWWQKEVDALRTENTRLRAALEEIAQAAPRFTGIDEIAREALARTKRA